MSTKKKPTMAKAEKKPEDQTKEVMGKFRTSDGQYFEIWSFANLHAQTLEDKEIESFE